MFPEVNPQTQESQTVKEKSISLCVMVPFVERPLDVMNNLSYNLNGVLQAGAEAKRPDAFATVDSFSTASPFSAVNADGDSILPWHQRNRVRHAANAHSWLRKNRGKRREPRPR